MEPGDEDAPHPDNSVIEDGLASEPSSPASKVHSILEHSSDVLDLIVKKGNSYVLIKLITLTL